MVFIKRLRNQNWLFPPNIADVIEEDHICRLVEDIVASIDFKIKGSRKNMMAQAVLHIIQRS